VAVSFIGGGNWKQPPTWHKSSPWAGFELTTLYKDDRDWLHR